MIHPEKKSNPNKETTIFPKSYDSDGSHYEDDDEVDSSHNGGNLSATSYNSITNQATKYITIEKSNMVSGSSSSGEVSRRIEDFTCVLSSSIQLIFVLCPSDCFIRNFVGKMKPATWCRTLRKQRRQETYPT